MTTKVICLKNNPLHVACERYAQELQGIISENHSLRKKVIQLKQTKQAEEDDTMNVSGLIKTSKHMQGLFLFFIELNSFTHHY